MKTTLRFRSSVAVISAVIGVCSNSPTLAVAVTQQQTDFQGKRLRVTADSAQVKSGSDVLATVRRGQVFDVLNVNGSWFFIETNEQGTVVKGWIHENQIEVQNVSKSGEDGHESETTGESSSDFVKALGVMNVAVSGKSVGVVFEDTVLQATNSNGSWLWVKTVVSNQLVEGWVVKSKVQPTNPETVEQSDHSLPASQFGIRPVSYSVAETSLDWKNQTVRVAARIPPTLIFGRMRLRSFSDEMSKYSNIKIDQTGNVVTFVLTQSQLDESLVPGTRSLWLDISIAEKVRSHRIDLPEARFLSEFQIRTDDYITDGVVISVDAKGLLPGFELYAASCSDVDRGHLRLLNSAPGTLPRLADTTHVNNHDRVRVVVPSLTDAGANAALLLQLHNRDGSLAMTSVRLPQTSSSATPEEHSTEFPSPLDAIITVPSLVSLPASRAVEIARLAGLRTRFVTADATSVSPVQIEMDRNVTRQGLAAGQNALSGDTILVTIDTLKLGYEDRRLKPSLPYSPIEIPDQNGFVSLAVANEPFWNRTATESLLTEEEKTDSPEITERDTYIDDGSESQPNTAFDESTLIDDVDLGWDGDSKAPAFRLIPIDFGQVVSIDPLSTTETDSKLTLLNGVADALLRRTAPENLPGAVGAAISSSIERDEDGILTRYSPQRAQQTIAPIIQRVQDSLELEITKAQRELLLADWHSEFSRCKVADELDRNLNGVVADDVVLWITAWLVRNEIYEPETHIQLAADNLGQAVAILYTSGGSSERLENPASHDEFNNRTTQLMPGSLDSIGVKGEETVVFESMPTEVRVPTAIGRNVSDLERDLRSRGLQIADAGMYFRSDRVEEINPPENSWVPSQSMLDLVVQRQVPRVANQLFAEAKKVLSNWNLRPTWAGNSFEDDVVVEQSPKAGSYVHLNEAIALELRIRVPSVVNTLQSNASRILSQKDLRATSKTRAFKSDTVFGQNPKAGTLAKHGDSIDLHLRLKVPNVSNGLALAEAQKSLRQWDLNPSIANRLARQSDRVRSQTPKAGTYVDHGSTVSMDRVVMSLPRVSGKNVWEVKRQLRDEDLIVSERDNLLPGDLVMRTAPAAGTEIERGKVVQLDGRVPVPLIRRGMAISDARRLIERQPNDLVAAIDGDSYSGDVVLSSSHRPSILVAPRTTIRLTPGVYVPRINGLRPEQAKLALERANLAGKWTRSFSKETLDRAKIRNGLETVNQNPNPGLYARSQVAQVTYQVNSYTLPEREVPDVSDVEFPVNVRRAKQLIENSDLIIRIRFSESTRRSYELRDREYTWSEFVRYVEREVHTSEDDKLDAVWISDQKPAGGTKILKGAKVVIVIGLPV